MNVPFNDLDLLHHPIAEPLRKAIEDVISKHSYIGKDGNPFVSQFEESWANYTGSNYCIACANGTDAIELSLRALGIGPGDEVIVPAQTWISTSEAVSLTGARPVFADIDSETLTISIEDIRNRITAKTKAIIPVHLYGVMADMFGIRAIAEEHQLKIIEDSAQAHGARYNGRHAGTIGDCGTFSFFPGKNLGAMGDAGGIVTNDEKLAKRLYRLRDHGRSERFDHAFEGRNSRLDGIQAAILSVKLPFLDLWTEQRRNAAAEYKSTLTDLGIPFQSTTTGSEHAYHIFAIEAKERETLKTKLAECHIATGVHYPIALPFLQAYSAFGYKENEFKNANNHARLTLSLPLFPGISEAQIDFVLNALKKYRNLIK